LIAGLTGWRTRGNRGRRRLPYRDVAARCGGNGAHNKEKDDRQRSGHTFSPALFVLVNSKSRAFGRTPDSAGTLFLFMSLPERAACMGVADG
jgi:hypothetical protein